MSERVCDAAECTYPQTTRCMQSYADVLDCPSHQSALLRLSGDDVEPSQPEERGDGVDGSSIVTKSESLSGEPVLIAPEQRPSLPRSGALSLRDTDALMRDRYVNLIGVVGMPNAGKTACIASLYLLLAKGSLQGFDYADSRTLMALDEIARGSRRWNDGEPPNQMTAHTELADDREAGFLHLRLRRQADGRKFDLLMPDLPGEWTRTLIDNGDGNRFDFLKAAEVVWLMVDGREFVEEKTRQLATYRTTNLIERLAAVLPTIPPRTILVATWRDNGEFPQTALEQIQDFGIALGFTIEFAPIASFSENPDVPPGVGLAELLEKTLEVSDIRPDAWPALGTPPSLRSFLNFGKRQ